MAQKDRWKWIESMQIFQSKFPQNSEYKTQFNVWRHLAEFSMPSSSESDPNLNFTCDDDLNRNHEIQDTSTTDNYVMNSQASNGHLDETNGLGNASISLADLDLSSDTLNEDPGTEASRSRDSPYRNDSNESLPAILPPNQKIESLWIVM